jgi:cytochrome b pre-mRNA-processing protein 3
MKNYINLFYNILETAEKWEKLNKNDQQKVFLKYLNLSTNNEKITNYFENYLNYLKNNTFNSLLKGVIKLNF